jgi:protein tyrosine phosphatase
LVDLALFMGIKMDWITDSVAIGNRIDAHDPKLRSQHGFLGLISLDGSLTNEMASNLGYDDWVCTSMVDGPGNDVEFFRKLVQDLVDMAEGSPPVLVHCHAGRSRSVTVVAGYLMKTRGWTAQTAYDFISSKRDTAVQAGLPVLLSRLG